MRCQVCGLPDRICDGHTTGVCVVLLNVNDYHWAVIDSNGNIVDRTRTQAEAEIAGDVKHQQIGGMFFAKYKPIS